MAEHLIISVGHKMPKWIAMGFDEYAKRMKANPIRIKEIRPDRYNSITPPEYIKQIEAQKIESVIPPQSMIVALDECGTQLTSQELADQMTKWQHHYAHFSWIIGGNYGLSQQIIDKAHKVVGLSKLTYPHPLVRIILAEQIYRIHSILDNHPYHRGR